MDLILGGFIDKNFYFLSSKEISTYELLLLQDDQELFSWFSDGSKVPKEFVDLIAKISHFVSLSTSQKQQISS
jgi:succinate dehydrogenase flavin-adding protein (antitoxin of CptAB toxin-antitoxin module)